MLEQAQHDASGHGDADENMEGRESLAAIHLRAESAKADRERQENKLRERVAKWSLWFVLAQLAVTDIAFAAYMLAYHGRVPSQVMIAWMTSTIVEIIGILWVIARSLFPFHDLHRDTAGEKHPHN